MRSILLIVTAAFVAAAVFVAGRVTAPSAVRTAAVSQAPDQAVLEKSIRAYLLANPEVLVEAMQEYERRQDNEATATASKVIKDKQADLFQDADSPVGGNAQGDVVVVEFNDYQCPYCKRTHLAMKSVVGADGKVKVIYKDIPILGEASKIAALAALASVKQGKHVPLHNALMEYSGKLDRDKILEIATSVGLDRAQLEKDMEDPKLKEIIERNMALASALGVRGTPAFVIGKQFVPGAIDAAALKALIADARKSQG
jgi:protein-disulfide isomerase